MVRFEPAYDGFVLLRGLRRRDQPLAAGRDDHDPGRRRHLRTGLGHGDRFICVVPRRDPRFPRVAVPAPRLGAAQVRPGAQGDQRRRGEGRGAVSLHAAADPGGAVLRHQPGDGPHVAAHLDLLLGEPDRNAGRYPGIRERGHPARSVAVALRNPFAGTHRSVRASGDLSIRRLQDHRVHQGAQGLRALGEAREIRSQHGGDRCGLGRAGGRPDCGSREGKGHDRRKARNGRRLPEHGLRAFQGPDQDRPRPRPDAAGEGIRA